MRNVPLWVFAFLTFTLVTIPYASAQSITGMSAMQENCITLIGLDRSITGLPDQNPSLPHSERNPGLSVSPYYCQPVIQAYSDTEEDYTASLYYNVQSTTALYLGSSSQPYNTANQQNNPTAKVTVNSQYNPNISAVDGIYSQTTLHSLDFFYVSYAGSYYDPYGYSSLTNGESDGNYQSDYWFYVNVVGTYIAEASVVLGETYSALNHNTSVDLNRNSRVYSVLYQAYIPFEWVDSVPDFDCQHSGIVDRGDNRGSNPSLGSYRAFQQISLGVGGGVPAIPIGVQDTGVTHTYIKADSLDTSPQQHFLSAALADQVPGDCHFLQYIGKANTNSMIRPTATAIPGGSSTTLSGGAANPSTPIGTPNIDWESEVSLSYVSPYDVRASGHISHDCFPAHELSVGAQDIYSYIPTFKDFYSIGMCLSGVGIIYAPISHDFITGP